jgi:hypothetical protein
MTCERQGVLEAVRPAVSLKQGVQPAVRPIFLEPARDFSRKIAPLPSGAGYEFVSINDQRRQKQEHKGR